MDMTEAVCELDGMSVRAAVARFGPHRLAQVQLPRARGELTAAVAELEAAALEVLGAVDAVRRAGADEAGRRAALAVIEQGCGFQDIVGQRLSKIEAILSALEVDAAALAGAAGVADEDHVETAADRRERLLHLNGPGLFGPGVTQDEIDALF